MEEKLLHEGVQEYRKKLRRELEERFCLYAKDDTPQQQQAAEAYGVPAFLDPRHRGLSDYDVSAVFMETVENIVKDDMRGVLGEAASSMQADRDNHERVRRALERRARDGSSEQLEVGSVPSSTGGGGSSSGGGGTGSGRSSGISGIDLAKKALEKQRNKKAAQPPASQGGGNSEAAPRYMSTPAEVMEAIVAEEFQRYLDLDISMPPDDVLSWWRDHRTEFPILAVVACMHLVVPASSGSVESVFSQAGLLNTAIRGSMSPVMLEVLLYLRVNWSSELLDMTAQEMRGLTPGWKPNRPAASADDTNRIFGLVPRPPILLTESDEEDERELEYEEDFDADLELLGGDTDVIDDRDEGSAEYQRLILLAEEQDDQEGDDQSGEEGEEGGGESNGEEEDDDDEEEDDPDLEVGEGLGMVEDDEEGEDS